MGTAVDYRITFPPIEDFVNLQIFEGAMTLNGVECSENLYDLVFSADQGKGYTVGSFKDRTPGIFVGNDLKHKDKFERLIGKDPKTVGFKELYNALSGLAARRGCRGEISKNVVGSVECIGSSDFVKECGEGEKFIKDNALSLQIFKTFRYISIPVLGGMPLSKQVTTYVDPEALLLFLTGVGKSTFSFDIRSGNGRTTYLASVNVSPSVLVDLWENELNYNSYKVLKRVDVGEFRYPVLLTVFDSFKEVNAYVHEAVELNLALQKYRMTLGQEATNIIDKLSIFILEKRKNDFVETGNFELTLASYLTALTSHDRSILLDLMNKAKKAIKDPANYISVVKLAHRYVFLRDSSAYYQLVRTISELS